MNKKPIILIIAPHSLCKKFNNVFDKDFYRSCDIVSEKGARLLNKLSLELGYETKLFLSDMKRIDENNKIINDYNRKDTRGSEWRIKIKNFINEKFIENKDIIIYEMHSFPNNSTKFKNNDIGLVSINNYKKETCELFKYLKNRKCYKFINDLDTFKNIEEFNNVNTKKPININDIIITEICDIMQETDEISKNQLSKYGITNIKNHYLIEFNEEINNNIFLDILYSIFIFQNKTVNICNKIYIIFIKYIIYIIISIIIIYNFIDIKEFFNLNLKNK